MQFVHTNLYCVLCATAPLSKSLDSPKAKELSGHLNQLDKDLALAEQDMLNRMRAPLNSSNPGADLSNRLKEQEVRKWTFCLLHTLYGFFGHLTMTLTCGSSHQTGSK